MSDATMDATSRPRAAASDLYRAVWRWHFYAGLLVLPFLITLSLTGAAYLFRDEIDAIVHADIKRVAVQEGETLRPEQLVASALTSVPGRAVKYTDPPAADLSAEVTVASDSGQRMAVYVNPYEGNVLGARPDRSTVMWTVRYLHSLRYFGPVARGIIEIVGGWTILLVGTGIFLWWPRGQQGGVVSVRGQPRRRIFWRDTHAVPGIFVGSFIVFLAITGLPWSQVWGGKVNEWANGSNFGYPSGVRVDVPMSGQKLTDQAQTSWSLEQAQIPETTPPAPEATPIGLDAAVARLEGLGLHPGYAVVLPSSPTGVYSGSVYPDDLSQQRVVHLDQYDGKPLVDMSYADYGPGGRWLEFGINTHMGQQFGLANQILLLAVCAGTILLAVSAALMWWKRRPSRSLGVPPMPQDPRVFRGLLAILIVGGILFPLTGASLLVMLALDMGLRRLRKPSLA
ncbi:PepSY domain-containing protein [Paracoccus sp. TK19116]|uniref:PepSY domain-containing protein n=1 Tax=Paracoccus albicereus TaxID=2922394 RepID=A0ABT1MSN8_9RHOB|nr:PepSY domain-containing protein [Paracoccus albicereus]MCQ0971330.1 PepSY domain-containing protein [Paracoccus albicereus]